MKILRVWSSVWIYTFTADCLKWVPFLYNMYRYCLTKFDASCFPIFLESLAAEAFIAIPNIFNEEIDYATISKVIETCIFEIYVCNIETLWYALHLDRYFIRFWFLLKLIFNLCYSLAENYKAFYRYLWKCLKYLVCGMDIFKFSFPFGTSC